MHCGERKAAYMQKPLPSRLMPCRLPRCGCRRTKCDGRSVWTRLFPVQGNQFLKLDPELKPSPLGDRFPPRRGKMSRSDKRGNRWRVAPDEGYLEQNAAVLRPHQSPAVTAAPLFVTCGDISPRRGENLSLPGEAFMRKIDFRISRYRYLAISSLLRLGTQ